MIHSQETQKLLEALANFVPEDQRAEFGTAAHAFLDSLTLDYEVQFEDDAGPDEIAAFSQAATALAPLNSEMRDRTLRALRALLLERGPTPIERFSETLLAALPSLVAAMNTGPFVKPESVVAPVSAPVSAPGSVEHVIVTTPGEVLFGSFIYENGKYYIDTYNSVGVATRVPLDVLDVEKYMRVVNESPK